MGAAGTSLYRRGYVVVGIIAKRSHGLQLVRQLPRHFLQLRPDARIGSLKPIEQLLVRSARVTHLMPQDWQRSAFPLAAGM
jgi:hypothetical protein